MKEYNTEPKYDGKKTTAEDGIEHTKKKIIYVFSKKKNGCIPSRNSLSFPMLKLLINNFTVCSSFNNYAIKFTRISIKFECSN